MLLAFKLVYTFIKLCKLVYTFIKLAQRKHYSVQRNVNVGSDMNVICIYAEIAK